MLGRTHLLFGLLLSLLALNIFFIEYTFLFVALVLLGSLFPDIDESSSIIGRKVKVVSWLFSHRGFFHSLYPTVFFSLLLYLFFGFVYALAFFGGAFFHLVLDSFTKRGVSIFWFDRRIKGFFVSGGLFELVIDLILVLCNVYLAIILL